MNICTEVLGLFSFFKSARHTPPPPPLLSLLLERLTGVVPFMITLPEDEMLFASLLLDVVWSLLVRGAKSQAILLPQLV